MTFEALYIKYFTPLVYFAYKRIHDEDTAKDLVQDVFRRIWEGDKLKRMVDEQHMKVYVYQGVVNACNNYYNGLKPNVDIEQAYYLESGEDISNDYIRIDLYRILYELVEQLPPECKRITKLYYKNGYKSGEIAKMLGLHVSTVKNQTRRGVLLLKQRYKVASKYQSL